jgi:hypothetical protein
MLIVEVDYLFPSYVLSVFLLTDVEAEERREQLNNYMKAVCNSSKITARYSCSVVKRIYNTSMSIIFLFDRLRYCEALQHFFGDNEDFD